MGHMTQKLNTLHNKNKQVRVNLQQHRECLHAGFQNKKKKNDLNYDSMPEWFSGFNVCCTMLGCKILLSKKYTFYKT